MCLGVPGQITHIERGTLLLGKVSFGSISKEVCLAYVPEAQVGDWVIVHAGFAITKLVHEEAQRVFEYLREAEQKLASEVKNQ